MPPGIFLTFTSTSEMHLGFLAVTRPHPPQPVPETGSSSVLGGPDDQGPVHPAAAEGGDAAQVSIHCG